MGTLLREVIGDVLRRARIDQGRTLREVSDAARVSLGYLSEVERGRKEASSELLSAICGALDVPLSRVLSDAGDDDGSRGTPGSGPRVGDRGQYRRDDQGRHPARRVHGGRVAVLVCGKPIGWQISTRNQFQTRRRNEPMANPFSKAWRYLMALFSSKVDEYADPKVQIQQAIEEAQRQHQALTQQAAQVIGNQRQLEMRLNRQLADIEKLQVNVRQALTLADQATSAGDAAKATEYNNAAEAFAAQLVTSEQSVEDLKGLHDQALQAAGQAKKAVEQNAMMLQQKIAERTKLLSQLEQAKMQEQVSASLQSMSELAAPGNTPSLDEVRRRSSAATPTRWVLPSWRRTPCRAACSRCNRPACRWPGIRGSSRSAPRCAAMPCRRAAVARPPRPRLRRRPKRRPRTRSGSSRRLEWQ